MAGVIVTVLGATLDASVLGNVLVFCAVLSWAIYTIFNRERMRHEPILGVISGSARLRRPDDPVRDCGNGRETRRQDRAWAWPQSSST